LSLILEILGSGACLASEVSERVVNLVLQDGDNGLHFLNFFALEVFQLYHGFVDSKV
jgi:hypothetical protein